MEFLGHIQKLNTRDAGRRHDAAMNAPTFIGKLFKDVGSGQHFTTGLSKRLALLLSQQHAMSAARLRNRPAALRMVQFERDALQHRLGSSTTYSP